MGREQFQKWRQEGADMLAKFEAQLSEKLLEIEILKAEVDSLRTDIAELRSSIPRSTIRNGGPASAGAVLQSMASISEAAARAVRVAPDATVIDVVRAVLAVADRPLPAKAIYQLVAAHHRDSSPSDVHRTLYRLKEAGEVDVTGERPNRLYVLREVQTVLAMTK